jgi:hypothetical protein
MSDILFTNFMKRWEEVTELPPQRLGRLTNVYKLATAQVKTKPWIAFLGVSVLVVGTVYLFFGTTITWFVTLLQRGF